MKTWVLLLFVLLCCNCVTRYQYGYKINMTEPNDPAIKKALEGEGLQIKYSPTPKGIDIDINNQTTQTVRILWNESSIIVDNYAGQVMHEEIGRASCRERV